VLAVQIKMVLPLQLVILQAHHFKETDQLQLAI